MSGRERVKHRIHLGAASVVVLGGAHQKSAYPRFFSQDLDPFVQGGSIRIRSISDRIRTPYFELPRVRELITAKFRYSCYKKSHVLVTLF